MTYEETVNMTRDEMLAVQEKGLQWTVRHAFANSFFYRNRLQDAGLAPEDVQTLADLTKLPFTDASDIRDNYPLGIKAVPEVSIVRIHASSGTTGKKKIVSYTRKDLADWAEMFARCFRLAELTPEDRIQVTSGYGLWTAGLGFQAGIEKFGAMAIPVGPSGTDLQLEIMEDMQVTAFCATSSYALLLGEEVAKRGMRFRLKLKTAVIGSERWSEAMRTRIEDLLDIETFDIPGMTELYGPGTGLDCRYHQGIHYWSDHFIHEIVDPVTGRVLPPGETGELVVTTLSKEAMPMIRYRTHDLTRLITAPCPCGRSFFRMDRILGRTDDMVKVHGVNIFPGQIDHVLSCVPELGSEYQIVVTRTSGRDSLILRVEAKAGYRGETESLAQAVIKQCQSTLRSKPAGVEILPPGTLPRTERKTKRVFDRRAD